MNKWIVILLIAIAGFFTWHSGRYERAFVATAKELKQRVPFDMAPGVRMDKAELRDKELITQVTLVNEQPISAPVQRQLIVNKLQSTLLTSWCHNDAIRHAFDKGYSMTSVTLFADGSELSRYTVGRVECICADQKGDICVH
jgi:hypothetical protein